MTNVAVPNDHHQNKGVFLGLHSQCCRVTNIQLPNRTQHLAIDDSSTPRIFISKVVEGNCKRVVGLKCFQLQNHVILQKCCFTLCYPCLQCSCDASLYRLLHWRTGTVPMMAPTQTALQRAGCNGTNTPTSEFCLLSINWMILNWCTNHEVAPSGI